MGKNTISRPSGADAPVASGQPHDFHAIFDHIQDAILLADDQARYVGANDAACKLTGYKREELLRKTVFDLTPPPVLAESMALWRQFVTGGRHDGEYILVRKDGARVEVEYRAVANVMPGVHLSSLRDITARKDAEAAQRRAKDAADDAARAKDRFLAMLSHELRTPLSPALLTVAAMAADEKLPGQVREDARMVQRNLELQTRLIDDLLDVTRIAHGKLQLHRETVDLHAVLRDCVQMFRAEADAKGVVLHLDLRAEHSALEGDSARLQQVLGNLLKNAIKFTPSGGTVTIRTSDGENRRIHAAVTDTGIGIEAHVLPHVFEAFEQGRWSVTQTYGGLGLGLAICKGLVEAHGGTINATSDGKNRGTTMTVELPLAVGASRSKAVIEGPDTKHPKIEMRILLVDDHEDTLRAMSRLLSAMRHRVRTATTVSLALRLAEAEAFDLLISDVGLQDGTGLDLMRQLLARKPIKGIALTGYGTETDIRQTREAGFSTHLTKPINIRDLERAIQRAATE